MLGNALNRRAVLWLLISRSAYAINWYNIASIFTLISASFDQGVSGLGILSSSFYLGIGLFQIPGGILAARIGPKLTVSIGTFVYSFAVIVSALATRFEVVILARFFVGIGMALVFAPAIILVTRYLRQGSEGLGVGLYISAFQAGGAVGLFGWVALATATGWRLSLVASGVVGLLTGFALLVVLPTEGPDSRLRVGVKEVVRLVSSRPLLLLGVVAIGLSVGSTLVSSFIVFYLVSKLGVFPATAGAVGALVFLIPIFSSLFGGRIYDRERRNVRTVIAISGLISALATALTGFGGIYGPVVAALLVGSLTGLGFAMIFSVARETSVLGPQYSTLAVAWVNAIYLTGSFFPPIVFSFLAETFSYTYAWLGGGILAFLLVLPVAFFRILPSPARPAERI